MRDAGAIPGIQPAPAAWPLPPLATRGQLGSPDGETLLVLTFTIFGSGPLGVGVDRTGPRGKAASSSSRLIKRAGPGRSEARFMAAEV